MKNKKIFSPGRLVIYFVVAFLAIVGVIPALAPRGADAAQMGLRSLSITSSIPSKTAVSYTFSFTTVTAGAIQGLGFQACTTAVGTCTAPSGLSVTGASVTSQTFLQTGAFVYDGTGAGGCIASASQLCAKRTQAVSEAAGLKVITFAGITNPSATNTAFFMRIADWGTNTYTTALDTGTTASATTLSTGLVVNAAVAEVLSFCVGNTAIDSATGSIPANCAAVSGTSLNIGTLDSAHTNVSPVSVSVQGDANNGIVMMRTNALNGSSISYDAIQAGGGAVNHLGALRVPTSTCSASVVNTDSCINSIGTTKAAIVSGTEDFGMTIAGINCNSVGAYTCVFSTGTYNLVRATNYNPTGSNVYLSDANQVTGTTVGSYAFDETGASQTLASASAGNVVDDEALMLKFAATPAVTTPFGAYSTAVDYTAVPTY